MFLAEIQNVMRCSTAWQMRALVVLALASVVGCGTTRENLATQQLLLSDAVDRSVAKIDFSPLSGEKVYLESRFLQEVKGPGFVNANYIISSLRQQLAGAGVFIQDVPDDADYIVEARVGTLGSDGHDIQYGLPASSSISTAAGLVSGSPAIPVLPELSLARRTKDIGAAKIALFAYHRQSRQPVWQSGVSVAESSSSGRWILGAGPFETGTIHEGPKFAGGNLKFGLPFDRADPMDAEADTLRREQAYRNVQVFDPAMRKNMVRMIPEPNGERLSGSYVMQLPKTAANNTKQRAANQPENAVHDPQVQPAAAEEPVKDSEEPVEEASPSSSATPTES